MARRAARSILVIAIASALLGGASASALPPAAASAAAAPAAAAPAAAAPAAAAPAAAAPAAAAPATTGASPAIELSPATVAAVRADADWTVRAQLPDGAIAEYVDRVRISPYLASYAAVGLAQAASLTDDRRYADAAFAWLQWYQAHEGPSGFVTDYTVAADGVEASTGTMDSTDAYAGMFLVAAGAWWKTTGDAAQLATLGPGVAGAVRAVLATQQPDGLTWALPDYHVSYLMDQSEALAGLRSAAVLAAAIGRTDVAGTAAAAAARMQTGINSLWDPPTGAYDWAVASDGAHQATTWSNLYPDALEQAWAVAYGAVPAARAAALMSTFAAAGPSWDDPQSIAVINGTRGPIGYWPVAAWAFARAGDRAEAVSGWSSIEAGAATASRDWPFTTASAGQLISLIDPAGLPA